MNNIAYLALLLIGLGAYCIFWSGVGNLLSLWVHEIGHAVMAKALGYQVEAFIIGDEYNPRFQKRIFGVDFYISLFPNSGCVRIPDTYGFSGFLVDSAGALLSFLVALSFVPILGALGVLIKLGFSSLELSLVLIALWIICANFLMDFIQLLYIHEGSDGSRVFASIATLIVGGDYTQNWHRIEDNKWIKYPVNTFVFFLWCLLAAAIPMLTTWAMYG